MRRNGLIFVLLGIVAVAIILPRFRGVAPTPQVFDEGWTLTEAKVESASSAKPVLALLTADWCPPCQQLKRGALSDSKVAAAIKERTIPVYVDVDHAAQDAQQFANIRSIPTMVLQVGDEEVGRVTGVVGAGELLRWLDETLARVPDDE